MAARGAREGPWSGQLYTHCFAGLRGSSLRVRFPPIGKFFVLTTKPGDPRQALLVKPVHLTRCLRTLRARLQSSHSVAAREGPWSGQSSQQDCISLALRAPLRPGTRGDLSEFLAARTCASCWLDKRTAPISYAREVKGFGRSKLSVDMQKTLNLLDNFFPEFENFGKNFSNIPCKIPKIYQKLWISVMTSSLAKHLPPPRHQPSSFGNPLPL